MWRPCPLLRVDLFARRNGCKALARGQSRCLVLSVVLIGRRRRGRRRVRLLSVARHRSFADHDRHPIFDSLTTIKQEPPSRGVGATTWARQHRAGIAGVNVHACASRLASSESCRRLEPTAFGAFRDADAWFLSETITLACCVTLPTIALPPSPTDTFCTVMAGAPWLRWRLSASIWAGTYGRAC